MANVSSPQRRTAPFKRVTGTQRKYTTAHTHFSMPCTVCCWCKWDDSVKHIYTLFAAALQWPRFGLLQGHMQAGLDQPHPWAGSWPGNQIPLCHFSLLRHPWVCDGVLSKVVYQLEDWEENWVSQGIWLGTVYIGTNRCTCGFKQSWVRVYGIGESNSTSSCHFVASKARLLFAICHFSTTHTWNASWIRLTVIYLLSGVGGLLVSSIFDPEPAVCALSISIIPIVLIQSLIKILKISISLFFNFLKKLNTLAL